MADVPRDPYNTSIRLFLAAENAAVLIVTWREIGQCFVNFTVISPFKDSFQRYTCLLIVAGSKTVRMTIIVFVVDTSASMNQRTYLGTTILDTAKGAVETFMKVNFSLVYVILRL